jgi:transcriptional regulator with XRE-family HTH domain
MIQQPELGKKISDLRKAKGLTQEELVDKCNLNVRTLQRIESGEVTPRTYTIRLIFEALDFSFEKSANDKGLIQKRLEQFYISFIDLFNLKTNTMKKIIILTVMTTAIILGVFAVKGKLVAQDKIEQKQENTETKDLSEKEIPFFDFSCYGCMEQKGLLIGRDMSFKLRGVKVKNVRLMAIDKETEEFNTLFIKGQFFENKVIAEYTKDWLIDGSLEYSANKIDKDDNQIILKGNAKVYDLNDKSNPDDDESIEAKEIIINLK